MKLRELEQFVGFKGKGLKQRAKALGYEFNLEDDLTTFQASELLEKLPACKNLKIYFSPQGLPEIELVGAWTPRDWSRVQSAVPRTMAARRRAFADAAAPKPQAVQQDKGVDENVARPNESVESNARPEPVAIKPSGTCSSTRPEQPVVLDGSSNIDNSRESEAVERNCPADNEQPTTQQ